MSFQPQQLSACHDEPILEPGVGSGVGSQAKSSNRPGLFLYDSTALQDDILSRSASKLEYHEYAVFKVPSESPEQAREVCHSILADEASGPKHFDLAFHQNHGLNEKGEFRKIAPQSQKTLEGRVRQIICRRNVRSQDGRRDGLLLSPADFAALDLHPGTLQYIRRTTSESVTWNRSHDTLSLILAFSPKPRPAFDFLSMTYSIPDRTATILIRQSFNASKHSLEDLPEYRRRMKTCLAYWAHPFVTPVVLLQVQLGRTEIALADLQSEVFRLEQDVSGMAGLTAYDPQPQMRTRLSNTLLNGGSSSSEQRRFMGKSTTQLMKHANDALRRSIRLLDTVRWMERAVRLLVQAGDELGDLLSTDEHGTSTMLATYTPVAPRSQRSRSVRQPPENLFRLRVGTDSMANHWHEIRQYLEGLSQLCMSLDTDRSMLEVRCKAQIDMIYSKMAQEDNNLNARMAVASTRDSSSMKALAVITAIFLPGEFIGTLFGMSMFDFVDVDSDHESSSPGTGSPGDATAANPVVTSRFWIYWAIVIPLSIVILAAWRAWWVVQDRTFRRQLSPELSEQRFWTDNGMPRELESSFWYDFFYLSIRRSSKNTPSGLERRNTLLASIRSISRDSTVDGRFENGRPSVVVPAPSFGTPMSPMTRMRHITLPDLETSKVG